MESNCDRRKHFIKNNRYGFEGLNWQVQFMSVKL